MSPRYENDTSQVYSTALHERYAMFQAAFHRG